MSTRLERRVIAKAASYTIKPPIDRPGTVFTNGGATGAVVFTLPTPGPGTRGWWYEFLGLVDQLITVAAPAVDTLITFNDLEADSVTSGASGQRIGARITAICVETSPGVFRWFAEFGTQGITFVVVS